MADNLTESRRDFLRKMLTAAVFTAACPHVLLGKIVPELRKDGDKIQGLFRVNFKDYPVLYDIWGSVRLSVPGIKGYFPKILVNHVDKNDKDHCPKCNMDYTSFAELCPHEGKLVFDIDPLFHDFTCSGHGTLFDAAGHYIAGPAAKDLEIFQVLYNDGDDHLNIEIPALVGVEDLPQYQILYYLHQNIPNPCSTSTTIEYGLENPSQVTIAIYDIRGIKVLTLLEAFRDAGSHTLSIDVSGLKAGAYICELRTSHGKPLTQKIIVKR